MLAGRQVVTSVMLSVMEPSTTVDVVITVVIGYVLGSIPVADLVAARRSAVDLRTVGDHNPGYWNAKETLGGRAALPVFIGDVAKGSLAALLGAAIADPGVWGMAYVGTGAAMVGHAFPVFARFRGGRSVLTFVGGAAVFAPVPVLVGVGVLLAVLAVTRSFAYGARAGFVVLPIATLVVQGPYQTAAMGVLMTFIGMRFLMARRDAPDRRR
jgi:glycerol-3-phosphate acyltransferase PlsY